MSCEVNCNCFKLLVSWVAWREIGMQQSLKGVTCSFAEWKLVLSVMSGQHLKLTENQLGERRSERGVVTSFPLWSKVPLSNMLRETRKSSLLFFVSLLTIFLNATLFDKQRFKIEKSKWQRAVFLLYCYWLNNSCSVIAFIRFFFTINFKPIRPISLMDISASFIRSPLYFTVWKSGYWLDRCLLMI